MNALTFGVIGAGSVGGILAAHLVHGGYKTLVCDIDREHLKIANTTGLEISGLRKMTVPLPEVCTDLSDMKHEKVDVLFLALKTTAIEPMIPRIRNIFHEDMLVVSYQNGLGNQEYLAKHFGDRNVARVIINYAANLTQTGKINMTFYTGSNYIGSNHSDVHPACKQIAAVLTEVGLPTEFSLDLKKHEWKKAILNCGLSPISALTGLTMKQIMENPETRSMVQGTIAECIDVARATGIVFPDGFLEDCMSYLDKAGPHKPSMLIDVECKSKTEIGFLNRMICKYGLQNNVDTPCNAMLTSLIGGIDKRHESERGEEK